MMDEIHKGREKMILSSKFQHETSNVSNFYILDVLSTYLKSINGGRYIAINIFSCTRETLTLSMTKDIENV
jgi:hypothetical protein